MDWVFLCYFLCWVNFFNSNKNTETPDVEFLLNLKNIIDRTVRTVSVSQSGTFQVAQRGRGTFYWLKMKVPAC